MCTRRRSSVWGAAMLVAPSSTLDAAACSVFSGSDADQHQQGGELDWRPAAAERTGRDDDDESARARAVAARSSSARRSSPAVTGHRPQVRPRKQHVGAAAEIEARCDRTAPPTTPPSQSTTPDRMSSGTRCTTATALPALDRRRRQLGSGAEHRAPGTPSFIRRSRSHQAGAGSRSGVVIGTSTGRDVTLDSRPELVTVYPARCGASPCRIAMPVTRSRSCATA